MKDLTHKTIMWFGDHQGLPLGKVPPYWLLWINSCEGFSVNNPKLYRYIKKNIVPKFKNKMEKSCQKN